MNGKSFSDAMSEIKSEYVDEALSYNAASARPKRILRIPAAAAAALLAVLVLGSAVLAASNFGTQLKGFFHSDEESGFDLIVAIEKTPVDALTGDVREAGDIIKHQFESFSPADNWYPGSWQTVFSTRDMACDYVGFEQLRKIDLGYEEQRTILDVLGNEEGQIQSVSLETDFAVGDMNAQFLSQIYTEYYEDEIETGLRSTENLDFEESFYTTANNKQCQIISSSTLESGYQVMDGHIVDDGVLYSLHIAYKESDSVQAEELMHHWADLF